jgi:tetratricopeptide (TPR) repeat protein
MLVRLYGSAQKLDLGLRHMEALNQILSANPDTSEADLMDLGNQVRALNKQKQAIEDEVEQRFGVETNPLARVQAYLQNGCVLKALQEIERAGPQLAGDIRVERSRIGLLLEVGRLEEAYESAGRFAGVAAQAGLSDWADVVALASLPQADYDGALNRWLGASDEIEARALSQVVATLPPRPTLDPNSPPWPIPATSQATELFFRNPERIASLRLNAALVNLERGELELAARYFRDVLVANPDSAFRPLVSYYISELTDGKEEIDLVPRSDRVSEAFEPEAEAAPEN